MKSSGMKRGLAVTAIAGLTLSGLAFASAQADTIADGLQGDAGVTLFAPANNSDAISTRFDGKNNTVTLLAGSPHDFGGPTVNQIHFTVTDTPGTGDVLFDQVVGITRGIAEAQWAPATNYGNVLVEVQAEASGGVPVGNPDSETVQTDNRNSNGPISLTPAAHSLVGVFNTGVGFITSITGKSGVTGGNTFLENTGPVATAGGIDVGTQQVLGLGDITAPDGNGLRDFYSVVPVDAANLPTVGTLLPAPIDPNARDEIVIHGLADNGADEVDDAQVYTAYRQLVAANGVTIAVEPGSSANVAGPPANENSFYLITVKDQLGNPVVGATVYESTIAGAPNPGGNGAIVSPVGVNLGGTWITNAKGQVRVRLQEADIDNGADQNPNPGIQDTFYTVEANGLAGYQNGGDFIVKATQTNIPNAPATIEWSNSLNKAMDDDETSQITVHIEDAAGDPVENASPQVNLRAVADDGTVLFDGIYPNFVGLTTDANGDVTTTFSPFENQNATYSFTALTNNGVTGSYEIEVGLADIFWDHESQQAQNGTTLEAHGVLELPSGTPLPGRNLGLTYFPSVDADANGGNGLQAGNAGFNPTATQAPGTISGTPTTGTATTDATGGFAVRVTDPTVPNGEELNGKILAESLALSDAEAPVNYGFQDGINVGLRPAVSDLLDVDFLRSLAVTDLRIINDFTGTEADGLLSVADGDNQLTPGALAQGHVEARNADGVLLTQADVNLTIDEGHFVDDFEATPVPGAVLDFNDAGKTATINTGVNGGEFLVNIERNTGFDDDGAVDDNLTATAGSASDGHDLTWTTELGNPLNSKVGDLTVEFSAEQESSILPDARSGDVEQAIDGTVTNGVGQVVDFDVRTVDQFGNRTSQGINVTDKANPLAQNDDTGESEFDLTQPAAWAWANPEATTAQTLEVELVGARKTVYVDNPVTSEFDPANPFAPVTQQPVDIEQDSATINWYEVDYAASSFTLGQEGPETVPVGTAVTEVVTATDQKGQGLGGLRVDFLRGGPSSEDDDTCNETGGLNTCQVTDDNGQAFYDFVGGSEGTANVSAVLYEDNGTRIMTVGPDTVLFDGSISGGQVHINVKLAGVSSQGKDILRVNAPSVAEGAQVRLQKKVGNQWVTIGKVKRLDGSGDRQFGVKDKNGKKVTKYRARVSANDAVFADTSPVKRVK